MNRTNRCLDEDVLVDAILGNLEERELPRIRLHLAECRSCREAYDSWRHTLSSAARDSTPPPPAGITLRVRVLLRHWRLRMERHPRWLAGAAAFMMLGLCIIGLCSAERRPPLHDGFPLAMNEPMMRDAAMVAETGTRQVKVVPTAPWIKGYAWVNPDSREVLIMLGGLNYDDSKDFQVWTEQGGSRTHLGLMEWSEGTAHLLYRGDEVPKADLLSVSLEPKGGSAAPTGPVMASVKLKE